MLSELVGRKLKGSLPAKIARKAVAFVGNSRTAVETCIGRNVGRQVDSSKREIVSFRGPRLVTVDPEVHLPTVRDENLKTVISLLRELGVDFWVFERPWPNAPLVNVMDREFDRAVQRLSAMPELTGWYGRAIGSNGRSRGREFLLSANASKVRYDAVAIYQYVLAGRDHSFKAGARQGVRIIRWRKNDLGLGIEAGAWNPVAVSLPDPETEREAFDASVAEADQLSGHTVEFPIDIVLTWVDGSDPVWLARKNSALGLEDNEDHVPDAADESRFESFDELRYCLRSIDQFAPWVRKIFIVTDHQTPPWLQESDDLRIVHHTDIWDNKKYLPVFNSHAIEANLHRIPGLSEHYLYMNDDFLLGRPVGPNLFFHPGGVSKVFYSRALVEFGAIRDSDNVSTVAAKNARALLASDGLPVMNRKFYHAPYALRRSVVEEIVAKYADAVRNTSSAKFRSKSDVAVSGSLYFQYALAMGHAVTGRIAYGYIDPAESGGMDRLRAIAERRNFDSIVINDGSQEMSDEHRQQIRSQLPAALELLVPAKSRFEK